ncbi:MAG: alpha-L-rhamnosidase, partial [Bacteroidota bacterium]
MKKIFLLLYLFPGWLSVRAQLTVQGLRVEFLKDPIGIEAKQPRLSWQLDSKEKGVQQLAYEIRVGKDVAALSRNEALVWKTGKITSGESLHQAYAGEPLQSAQPYYWQVRVWDNKGHSSPWSKGGTWQMGLLTPEEWKAQWIGLD